MSPREALLRDMLAAARDRLAEHGWNREVNEQVKGFSAAIEVVNEWAKMSDAPPPAKPELPILGDASCAEAAPS